MGWKAFKEHYGITHNVEVIGDEVHIGSGFIPKLVAVNFKGEIAYLFGISSGGDLNRVISEIKSNPCAAKILLESVDTFESNIKVYSFDGAEIIEDFCEQLGYPHNTHSGKIMYEGSFFTDRQSAISAALASARSHLEGYKKGIEATQKKLAELNKKAEKTADNVAALMLMANGRSTSA